MSKIGPIATLSDDIDKSGRFAIWGDKQTGKVFIYDLKAKKAACEHRHGFQDLQGYLEAKKPNSPLCPLCPLDTNYAKQELAVGQPRGSQFFSMNASEMDAFFYESLNSPRDYTFPRFMHVSMYGKIKKKKDLRWKAKYADFGIDGPFVHQDGKVHMDFEMAYDIFEPRKTRGRNIATIVLTNGVPVNRTELYDVAELLSRFVRVVVVDLFGMGWSSMPLEFKDKKTGEWLWRWELHARIFRAMFADLFSGEKVFFGANDWGSAAVQKFLELFYSELKGAGIYSGLLLNAYWVQHIGSLQALALLPYPSPTFHAEAVRFAGTLTALLETMFFRTPEIQNQYTMAPLQAPYVEISYDDPTKNPANTEYKDHAVRVLAEQGSQILGLGQLLPYHVIDNPDGMRFTNWHRDGANVHQMHGKKDKMMCEGQVHSFENMVAKMNADWGNKITYRSQIVENAGHFMFSDQPEKVADGILKWIRDTDPLGYKALARSYWGFTEIARKDEKKKMKMWDKD